MILVDSDVLIEVTRGRAAKILAIWEELSGTAEPIACSPVTIAELWHGARAHEQEALTRLFHALACLPIDHAVGRQAGEYLSRYHRSHHLLLGDALIAATASVHGAVLWTMNRKHFPMKDLSFFEGSPL